jgi:PKD repeat protein
MLRSLTSLPAPARRLAARVGFLLVALATGGSPLAGQLKLAWDPVPNAIGYRLHYGSSSGTYSSSIDAQNSTAITVPGLTDGTRYFFVVQAYAGTTTSGFSNEVNAVVPAPPPVASFTASPATGTAPLLVTLTDTSTGSITGRSWNLGDGTTATTRTVAKTYSSAGTYVVTLTVTGSGGSTTVTRSITVTAPPTGGGTTPPPPTGGGTTPPPPTGGGTTPPPPTGGGTTPPPPTGGGTTPPPATGGSGSPGGINGLVAAYGFEERTGAEIIDASGSANHGRISGAARVRTAFFGRALRFDGRRDWVTVADSASLDITKGITLQAWLYPTERLRGWTTVLMKERSRGPAYALSANSDARRPATTINTGGEDRHLSAGPHLPVNTWTHLAATYDGATQRLYVNGALAGSRPQAGSIAVSGGKLRIGGNSIWDDEFFTGYIDEVRIYNRALTEAEILADSRTAVVGLLLSRSPDRSNPIPLHGVAVAGTIYVHYEHISPAAATNPVRQVAFWLNDPNPTSPRGTPTGIETGSPFDFAGTTDSGAARGFDTSGLSAGVHTITARVTLRDGTVLPFIHGTFRITAPSTR